MRLLTKEFYALSELQAAWDMPDQDVYYLAMSGQLKLTFMVHDTQVRSPLPLMHYRNREVGRNYSGILDLKVRDADTILKAGSAEVWMFEMPNGDDGRLVSVDDKILVRREDLLVTHDQREHVERNILKLHEPVAPPVSAEMEYSWDYRRVELGDEIFSLGPKQARIVGMLHRAYMEGDPWRRRQWQWPVPHDGNRCSPEQALRQARCRRRWHGHKSRARCCQGGNPMKPGALPEA